MDVNGLSSKRSKLDIEDQADSRMETSRTENLDKPTLNLSIPFRSEKEAEIAYNSIRVDGEPKRSQVVKTLSVNGNKLCINLVAPDTRQIRLTMNTVLDQIVLVQKVIDKFTA